MERAGYIALTRQGGLFREMRVIANNIANAATTGYRQEGVIFSEHVKRAGGDASLSMANANVRHTSMIQGALAQTGGRLDLAIEGDGFFLIETPAGERLTRAGNFSLSVDGDLVTNDGFRVLDAGGAPVFIPPDAADPAIAADGTISIDDQPVARIGLVQPVDRNGLAREDGVMFRSEAGTAPAPDGRVLQGFLEGANVDPVSEIARMIEVQRAYEMGQSFLDAENERTRAALKTFIR